MANTRARSPLLRDRHEDLIRAILLAIMLILQLD
jgi:hypothetical protein